MADMNEHICSSQARDTQQGGEQSHNMQRIANYLDLNDDRRGRIRKYPEEKVSRWKPRQWVTYQDPANGKEYGPYKIAGSPSPQTYKLCSKDGTPVFAGRTVKEEHLREAKPA